MPPTAHSTPAKVSRAPLAGCGVCRLLALALLAPLAGCFSVRTQRADGTEVVHHFGYAREEHPVATGGVQVADFSSFGLRVDQGVHLGWWKAREERVPLDDRFVVHVKDRSQLEAVLRALALLEADTSQTCILVSPPP
jgi:hypothetical protein